MAGRRLSREKRHLQLLDTAAAIVRAEGADSLTLARVAEEAGVSKPITYLHFETRTGLLKALYRRIDHLVLGWLRRSFPDVRFERDRETITAYGDLAAHLRRNRQRLATCGPFSPSIT